MRFFSEFDDDDIYQFEIDSMKLYAHMFMLQLSEDAIKVQASEIRIAPNDDFQDLIDDMWSDDYLTSSTHGSDLGNHINKDLERDLAGQVIKKYHFDSDWHFVGFTLLDVEK